MSFPVAANKWHYEIYLAITAVQNAVRYIGIHFVGMKLFKTAAPGIVKNVAPAGTGGSGIVRFAIGAPMA